MARLEGGGAGGWVRGKGGFSIEGRDLKRAYYPDCYISGGWGQKLSKQGIMQ